MQPLHAPLRAISDDGVAGLSAMVVEEDPVMFEPIIFGPPTQLLTRAHRSSAKLK
jgi:hypothetical protein